MNNTTDVLRLDFLSQVGRDAARAYGVSMIPTTLLIDNDSNVLIRHVGMPPVNDIVAQVNLITAKLYAQ